MKVKRKNGKKWGGKEAEIVTWTYGISDQHRKGKPLYSSPYEKRGEMKVKSILSNYNTVSTERKKCSYVIKIYIFPHAAFLRKVGFFFFCRGLLKSLEKKASFVILYCHLVVLSNTTLSHWRYEIEASVFPIAAELGWMTWSQKRIDLPGFRSCCQSNLLQRETLRGLYDDTGRALWHCMFGCVRKRNRDWIENHCLFSGLCAVSFTELKPPTFSTPIYFVPQEEMQSFGTYRYSYS